MYDADLRNSYADFLTRYEWDSFYTVTCRKPRRDSIAFVRDIRDKLFHANPETRSFVAIEPHQTGMLHAHGLVHWNNILNKDTLREHFCEKARANFGFSRFSVIRSMQAVNLYCAKYVLKKACDNYEYDFLGEDWNG